MDWTDDAALRVRRYQPTRAVTDILKLAERPEVISLAGGLPDPEAFPLEPIRESMERVMRDEVAAALNYGANPGYSKLREWIATRMGEKEAALGLLTPEHILVSSGGAEGIGLVAMSMIDEGDVVLVEEPTYMVALHIFRTYGARIVSVPTDEEGLSVEALEARLAELDAEGRRPRFLYMIPSFQNPSGGTLGESRRRELAELASERDLPILEDHAYAELSYDRPPLPSMKSLAPDRVLFVHTFSKIFGPGVRLGWVAAPPKVIERLGLCKIGVDQCANSLTQRLVYDYGKRGHIETQVASSIELYRRKRDRMEEAMRKSFPAEATWVHPGGGFFLWVRLPEGVDSEKLLLRAIEEEKTAFVAGPTFFVEGGANFLRLSFSYVPEEQIEEGIERVSRALKRLHRAGAGTATAAS